VWERVPGTQISIIRQDQRPVYDMFSFDSNYYVYDKGFWYRSQQLNGPYISFEASTLPPEFHTVPRTSWLSYPSDWSVSTSGSDNIAMGQAGTAGTIPTANVTVASDWAPTVSFSTAPHWTAIPGTGIYQVRASERPKYDLFRYGANYYVYQNGGWYKASRTNGPYASITVDAVPPTFRSVRQNYWVTYPTGWTYVDKHGKVKKVKIEDK
jgi:hypothetical protein